MPQLKLSKKVLDIVLKPGEAKAPPTPLQLKNQRRIEAGDFLHPAGIELLRSMGVLEK